MIEIAEVKLLNLGICSFLLSKCSKSCSQTTVSASTIGYAYLIGYITCAFLVSRPTASFLG